jgi:acyl-CoA synthetase (AMP-forming)/AMP-acid ligase II
MHNDIDHLLAQPFGSLPELIAQQAAHRPRHPALILGAHSLDYAALRTGMDRVARSLQRDGLGPGDVVAICAGTSVEYVLAYLGALRAGVAVAPKISALGLRDSTRSITRR